MNFPLLLGAQLVLNEMTIGPDQYFVIVDGDHIGNSAATPLLHNDVEKAMRVSKLIHSGQSYIAWWSRHVGGQSLIDGGDNSVLLIPRIANLEELRDGYREKTGFTLSVGTGPTTEQADKSLVVAKWRGRDQVVNYDDQAEKDFKRAQAEANDALKLHAEIGESFKIGQNNSFGDFAEAWDGEKQRMHFIPELIKLVDGRKPEEVDIASVKGGTKDSPGFSEEKLAKVDTSYPILVDSEMNLVDGRHRKLKLLTRGEKKINVIVLTKADIDGSALSEATLSEDLGLRENLNEDWTEAAEGLEISAYDWALLVKISREQPVESDDPGLKWLEEAGLVAFSAHSRSAQLTGLGKAYLTP